MSLPRSSGPETDVSGLLCMEEKKGFILCLMARGEKNVLSRSRECFTPEEHPGAGRRGLHCLIVGEQRPFESGVSSSKLQKMGG